MTRARLAALALATCALTACVVERPVRDRVTLAIEANDTAHVRVVAETSFPQWPGRPPRRMAARLDALRESLAAGRDEWSVRFNKVQPENERIIFDRKAGVIERAEHSATIDRAQLESLFADMPVTIQLLHGEGWSELAIYPGSSRRATRAQAEHYEKTVQFFSEAVARYLAAMHRLYGYLDAQPHRTRIIYAALLGDDPNLILTEEEHALVEGAGDALNDIMTRLDAAEDQAYTLTEEADLAHQPLAADVYVELPDEPTLIEGFARTKDGVAIVRPSLLDAVTKLEGRWLSPDPLAMRLHDPEGKKEIDIEALAREPRHHTTVVTPDEITQAVFEQLQPKSVYRVRWAE